jgi:hypothetical protein
MGELYHEFSEPDFILDLHDGLWYYVPEENGKELLLDMKSFASNIDYEGAWGRELPVALPFDAQLGTTFGNVKPIGE